MTERSWVRFLAEHHCAVASLGLVSPGAATEGVTHIFSWKKLTTLFLVITVCQFCGVTPRPIYFLLKKLTTFLLITVKLLLISLGCHPLEGVTRGGPPRPQWRHCHCAIRWASYSHPHASGRWCPAVEKVTVGIAESKGSLPAGLWLRPADQLPTNRDQLRVLRSTTNMGLPIYSPWTTFTFTFSPHGASGCGNINTAFSSAEQGSPNEWHQRQRRTSILNSVRGCPSQKWHFYHSPKLDSGSEMRNLASIFSNSQAFWDVIVKYSATLHIDKQRHITLAKATPSLI